jgi:hypothetical protein
MTEAHAKLFVLRNCSRSLLRVCLGMGEQLAGGGWSAVAGGGGRQTVHRKTESGAVYYDRKLLLWKEAQHVWVFVLPLQLVTSAQMSYSTERD